LASSLNRSRSSAPGFVSRYRRQRTVASDLRFITAAIKITNNLERMGGRAAKSPSVRIDERGLID